MSKKKRQIVCKTNLLNFNKFKITIIKIINSWLITFGKITEESILSNIITRAPGNIILVSVPAHFGRDGILERLFSTFFRIVITTI